MMHTGYSQRPLAAKLGIKPGMKLAILHAPEGYREWVAPLPAGVIWLERLADGELDFIHYFSTERAILTADFARLKAALCPAGMLWISWPKRAAKVGSNLDENIVRAVGLDHGLVDVKVAAIDQIWSGLKFVYRLADRSTP